MNRAIVDRRKLGKLALGAAFGAAVVGRARAETTLLNVSYDPTRELYQAFNAAFIREWQYTGGEALSVQQSHGGSGEQARAVIESRRRTTIARASPASPRATRTASRGSIFS